MFNKKIIKTDYLNIFWLSNHSNENFPSIFMVFKQSIAIVKHYIKMWLKTIKKNFDTLFSL